MLLLEDYSVEEEEEAESRQYIYIALRTAQAARATLGTGSGVVHVSSIDVVDPTNISMITATRSPIQGEKLKQDRKSLKGPLASFSHSFRRTT